jgi:D-aminopeptidase
MTRLHDLGLCVGKLPAGRLNAITDVAGLSVGYQDVSDNELLSGITVVGPYPAAVGQRMLPIGKWSLARSDSLTGLGVAEDFGTFSSPIALVPDAVVGRVYDSLIQTGLGRDPGLSTYAGWPPVVVGINDSALNLPATTYVSYRDEHLTNALTALEAGVVRQGNQGIGRGLCAFGLKGGVGTASRLVQRPGTTFRVGAFVALNGGELGDLCVDRFPITVGEDRDPFPDRPRSFAAVVATDVPLIPVQCQELAFRATSGLYRVGIADAHTDEGLTLAFSTIPAEPAGSDGDHQRFKSAGDDLLRRLAVAAADSCEEAVLNGMLAAESIHRNGVHLKALGIEEWPQALEALLKGAP